MLFFVGTVIFVRTNLEHAAAQKQSKPREKDVRPYNFEFGAQVLRIERARFFGHPSTFAVSEPSGRGRNLPAACTD